MITAVVVDNGEPLLWRSLRSLRSQSIPVVIIVCPGPKSDLEAARKYADRVLEPVEGIGKARVKGILAAETDYILSCDSDTIYDRRYAEYALENLRQVNAVRAGTILPLDWSDGLGLVETMFSLLPPYEFAYAFRKSAFLNAELHREDYSSTRSDIGWYLAWRLLPRIDPRMRVWTRLPTQGAKTATAYVPSALAALATVVGVAAVPLANELSKIKIKL